MKRILALCLAAALLLSGCSLGGVMSALEGESGVVKYSDMVYTRPDMDQIAAVLDDACDAASRGESLEEAVDGILAYYDTYDDFYTNYSLAYIRYNTDLTDSGWEQEYLYCGEKSATVDAGLDTLYYALADSPLRGELESDDYFGAGFFDDYEGETIWDETFVSLLEQEAQLQSEYYGLSSQAVGIDPYSEEYFTAVGAGMAQILVDLVAVRQQIAAYAGYNSYVDFAYDFYFYRDYTPAQVMDYLEQIRQELVPLYEQVNVSDVWDVGRIPCTEDETFQYVRTCAQEMGGSVWAAFCLMRKAELYDIRYGENKYDISFEVYLDSYQEPFVFMNPGQTVYDKQVFAHEFGHFVNDYNCGGSYSSTDVAEVFSQAMEYLSLCCCKGTEDLERLKLADCLCTYVEQAAYASFEHQLYSLTGEALTVENVAALYEQTGLAYGFDSWGWDSRDFIQVTHFYTEPMYIISYVVSNDVAFGMYQMEKAEAGAGVASLKKTITGEGSYLLTFAKDAGLESPFAAGRLQSVRQSLEAVLG